MDGTNLLLKKSEKRMFLPDDKKIQTECWSDKVKEVNNDMYAKDILCATEALQA